MGAGGAILAPLHMEQAWCHYQSHGVAILFRTAARTLNFTVRHRSAPGRTVSVHFTFGSLPYTVVCVYASSVATERPHYRTQDLLSSTRADNHLLVGGDFNCIAGQQDVLYPANLPGQRDTGYWTGLCHVETDHSLYDVRCDLNANRELCGRFPTSPRSGQSAARLDPWLIAPLSTQASSGSFAVNGPPSCSITSPGSARSAQN